MTKNKFIEMLKGALIASKGKSDPLDVLRQFEDAITDWEQPGEIKKVPGEEEIRFGPVESASGEGASRMVRQYSDFASQIPGGLVDLYTKFSRELANMKDEMEAVKAVTLTLKGEKKGEDTEAEKERSEMVEKAKRAMKKARVLIAKAEDADEDGEENGDEEEQEELKENLNKARKALKAVREYLRKAEEAREEDDEDDEDEDDREESKLRKTRKSLLVRLQKAEEEGKKREEESKRKREEEDRKKRDEEARKAEDKRRETMTKEEREEEDRKHEEAKKADEAARKAKEHDEGNQADKQDPATGNQAAASAKGGMFPMTEKSVSEVMAHLMGVANGSIAPAPAMAKANPSVDFGDMIEDAVDNGTLTEDQAIEAQSILSRVAAVKAGVADTKLVADAIAKAHPNVRSIFSKAAA